MKLKSKILILAAFAGMLLAEDSGGTFRCAVDGRDERIRDKSAINFPSCDDVICNRHVKWVRVGDRRWWVILLGGGKLIPVCPIHGVE